jgi:3-hydroxybutyryl-CoA dehydratase
MKYVVESVSAEHMKTLARALEDPNPIHLDPAEVERLGMGTRVINQGPANCSYIVNMLREAYPQGTITQLEFRLLGNVFGGDRAIAGGEITAEGETIQLSVWLDVEGRGRVVDGTATVRP